MFIFSAGIFSGSGGKWRAAYEQKGIVKVTGTLNSQPMDGEKMLDAAIEAGAEDVQRIDEDDDTSFYEVIKFSINIYMLGRKMFVLKIYDVMELIYCIVGFKLIAYNTIQV